MKYSFLLPYHKRDTLTETAKSFLEFYSNRNDYELIIVESRRTWENEVEHNKLLNIIKEFESKMSIKHYKNMDTGYSCSVAYNIAFKNSSGDFLVVTNPECYHTINILGEFDKLFEENKNCYIICACEAVNPDKTHFSWYQHSIHMNRMLHFCTAISKRNWLRTNGFCEALAGGIGFEDDDFLDRVKLLNIPIIVRDDLLVKHIEHSRDYLEQNRELSLRNRDMYNFIWNANRTI